MCFLVSFFFQIKAAPKLIILICYLSFKIKFYMVGQVNLFPLLSLAYYYNCQICWWQLGWVLPERQIYWFSVPPTIDTGIKESLEMTGNSLLCGMSTVCFYGYGFDDNVLNSLNTNWPFRAILKRASDRYVLIQYIWYAVILTYLFDIQ